MLCLIIVIYPLSNILSLVNDLSHSGPLKPRICDFSKSRRPKTQIRGFLENLTETSLGQQA